MRAWRNGSRTPRSTGAVLNATAAAAAAAARESCGRLTGHVARVQAGTAGQGGGEPVRRVFFRKDCRATAMRGARWRTRARAVAAASAAAASAAAPRASCE